ncbi:hypothetical protein PVAND_000382 [Polypedilum vanderplanki]|uniref:C2H2-type domain-containing protein n=1 Tax=Polypedilum vanderplanki TaxID=319348 RepID=A0A9J6BKS0_POLVA|nr:hypothetical protein PVAND_000382 [Polypedilum vanderplanki]
MSNQAVFFYLTHSLPFPNNRGTDLKKLGKFSPQSDEQPCDLRLFTPATCLIEFRNAAAAAAVQAQVQNLSQAASSVLSNNSTQSTTSIGPNLASSQQIPFIKGLGLLPRSSLTPSQREHGERDKTRLSTGSSSQLSPLSLTPIQTSIGGGAPYSCSRCGNTYARPHSLNRHIRFECGVEPKFECPVCHKKSKHRQVLKGSLKLL